MKLLQNMHIGVKVLLAPLLALGLMFVIGATSIIGSQRQNQSTEVILKEYMPNIGLLAEGEKYLASSAGGMFEIVNMISSSADPKIIDTRLKQIISDLDEVKKNLVAIAKSDVLDKSQKEAADKLIALLTAYRNSVNETVEIALLQPQMAATFVKATQSRFGEIMRGVGDIRTVQQKRSQEAYDKAQIIASNVRATTLTIAFISIVVALIVTFIVRKNILNSVQKIRDAVVGLSKGDLRTRIELTGKDEIAETAQAINRFVDGIHRVVSAVSEGATMLTNSAKELTVVSTAVAQGSTKQSDAASTISSTVQQMTAAVSSIAENADVLRKASKNSLQCTETGAQNLGRLSAEINGVGRAFDAINASVGEFVASATSITNMTKHVKELAEQTNLLALNAAIEAARAGEQGRGFSVVADEVRKLAERSALAASDIDAVTAAISQKSGGVDQSLQDGSRSLGSCKKHVDELESIFTEARNSVQESSRGVEDIADSVREQSSGSADMARNIDNIAQMAEENSAATVRSLEASHLLESLAQTLHSAISKFST